MDLPTELFDYVKKRDDTFDWERVHVYRDENVREIQLRLTSQTWQGIVWHHQLHIFIPNDIRFPDIVMLTIGADGANSEVQDTLGGLYAESTGMVCAYLYDVPNQPLFDNHIEDGLIAYTLVRYLDTQDPTWPLLFPMVKSAVRAMDTVTEICIAEGLFEPTRFVVTGASKRGWTTWLTAVVDPRVAGIAPVVFDSLNLPAQFPHQKAVFETYSEQIGDYAQAGLLERLNTPLGYYLALMIDPYTYRERLTLPKLILNGANDRYWATDALNLYWNDLPESKSVLIVPNARHSLNDPERLHGTLLSFVQSVAEHNPLTPLQWQFTETPERIELVVHSARTAQGARCWVARSATQDFRESIWEERDLSFDAAQDGYVARIDRQADGYVALYGEVVFEGKEMPYFLSTQVRIAAGSGR